MENASKALIIAGAILIAILLISVGILVMNSINKQVDQAQIEADAEATRIYLAKFTPYEGRNKTAMEAKQLILLAKQEGVRVIQVEGKTIWEIEQLDNSERYYIVLNAAGTGKIDSIAIYIDTERR